MKKILLLDNYDSFVYNIVHLIEELGYEVDIIRNDKISLEAVDKYDKIILSPGPGIPSEAGIMMELIKRYAPHKCILGICLGHQAIGEAFGAKLTNLSHVFHGVESEVDCLVAEELFDGVESPLKVGRYHSWIVDRADFPAELEITAVDSIEGQIMALRHRRYDIRGVQFHPESILTPQGAKIIGNWLNRS